MAFLLTWKNVLPVLLKSPMLFCRYHTGIFYQVHGVILPRGGQNEQTDHPKLSGIFFVQLLDCLDFSANWTLENIFFTFNRHNYRHQNKMLQQWRHFVFRDHVFTVQRPRACACIIPSCCLNDNLSSFSSLEPRILWLRMTRGSRKLCRSLAKIWLFRPHGACS